MTLIAAADGSALGNPGPAGWAWYIDPDRWASGGWPHGTNNMGELTAVLDLLRQTAGVDDELLVYCDSMYVINSLTKWMPGWKRKGWRKGDGKPVLNVEIMKELDAALAGRRVRFEWVKGHAGHPLNEEADRLANAAAVAFSQGRQPDAGPGLGGAAASVTETVGDKATRPADPVGQPSTTGTGSRRRAARPASEEPDDLFSAMADQLAPEPSDIDRVIVLERALASDDVRADPASVAALLHPDWCEIGRSGRLWTRADCLATIGPLLEPVRLEVVSVDQVDARTILLIWRSIGAQDSALRSSLWVKDDDWRQRFHQGTAEP
ncbi:MAG: ribonuclease HI family protein [Micropruina sp.]|uniref:RNase H family protein n=1 Tax=Micropruina sp. TaxID=2737536 RepID=UPI0039E5FB97